MKKIILTGATGGLGRHLVHEIHAMNDTEAVCVFRDRDKYDRLFATLTPAPTAYCQQPEDDFLNLLPLLEEGSPDGIVLILNAASVKPIARIGTPEDEALRAYIAAHITTPLLLLNRVTGFCAERALPLRVIHIDSGAADHALKGWMLYASSKTFFNTALNYLQEENPSYEIVSFDPGVMDTDMQGEIRASAKEVFDRVDAFIAYKENGRLRDPADVARQIRERYLDAFTATALREKVV